MGGPETRHSKTESDVASPEFHGLVMSVVREKGFPYWQAKILVLKRQSVLDGKLEGDNSPDLNDPLTVKDITSQGDPSDPETLRGDLIGIAAAKGVSFSFMEQNGLILIRRLAQRKTVGDKKEGL